MKIKMISGKLPHNTSAENVCVFSHYDNENVVSEYVYNYLKELKNASCDIVFVSTSKLLSPKIILELENYCSIVIVRENEGYDFGSYKCGIELIDNIERYRRLIIANDSVYGPLSDINSLISYGDNILDIWGATDSYDISYHIQSYFMVYSSTVFLSSIFTHFWNQVALISNETADFKKLIIDNYEVGGSTYFIAHGFKLGAFCGNDNITEYVKGYISEIPKNSLPHLNYRVDNTLNPTHFYWDFLIRDFNCPFIKKELLLKNPVNIRIDNWINFITKYSEYNINLILSDSNRINKDYKQERFDWFFEEVETSSGIKLPYFLTQILTVWPDLIDTKGVSIENESSILNLLAYWENPIKLNAKDILWPKNNIFPPVVYEIDDSVSQDAVLPITKGLIAAWRTREDLQSFIDINTEIGRNQLILWKLAHGCNEYRYLSLTEEEKNILNSFLEDKFSHLPTIAKLLPCLYINDEKISKSLLNFDVDVFNQCWAESKNFLLSLIGEIKIFDNFEKNKIIQNKPFGTFSDYGVNAIGFPRAFFGIAEDVRTTALALMMANVPLSVCSSPIPLSTKEDYNGWIEGFIRDEPTYNVNIINMPSADTFQLLLRGWAGLFINRYNIAAWQWELPIWPKKWIPMLEIVDEIWAQSHFVEEMFKKYTNKPVIYMPLAIEQPKFNANPRSYYGIPNDSYVYLSVFDCNSWIKRKNPLASIKAFSLAFPNKNDKVNLVVKLMNPREGIFELEELINYANQDNRIILINETLSRNDMLALINCCDVFVSLHRSEGFGRVIAESMIMGKPVISTNFSGSVDFAHEGTAFIVNGPLIEVKKGDYVEFEEQYWMDPDIEIASNQFRLCFEQPDLTGKIAEEGQLYIQKNHSIEAYAKRLSHRLNEIRVLKDDFRTQVIKDLTKANDICI